MHMNPNQLDADGIVSGKLVHEGDLLGKVGNYNNRERGTTYHLHFDMQVPTKLGWVFVNPYMTLVAAYERLIGARGTEIKDGDPVPPVRRHSAGHHAAVGNCRQLRWPPLHTRRNRLPCVQNRIRRRESQARSARQSRRNAGAASRRIEVSACALSATSTIAMQRISPMPFPLRLLSRRAFVTGALGVAGSFATRGHAWATQPPAFAHWVANFRPRALKRGISEQTYDRVMGAVTPDTSVYAENSVATGIHRIDVAIHQPALLWLARDDRQRTSEGIRRPAFAH